MSNSSTNKGDVNYDQLLSGFQRWLTKHNNYSSSAPLHVGPPPSSHPMKATLPLSIHRWAVVVIGPAARWSAANFTPSAVLTTGQCRTEWPLGRLTQVSRVQLARTQAQVSVVRRVSIGPAVKDEVSRERKGAGGGTRFVDERSVWCKRRRVQLQHTTQRTEIAS